MNSERALRDLDARLSAGAQSGACVHTIKRERGNAHQWIINVPSNEVLRRYFVLYAPSSLIPVINQDSYLVHDQASPHPSADLLNVSQHIAPSLQSPWQTRHHQIFPFSAVKP